MFCSVEMVGSWVEGYRRVDKNLMRGFWLGVGVVDKGWDGSNLGLLFIFNVLCVVCLGWDVLYGNILLVVGEMSMEEVFESNFGR